MGTKSVNKAEKFFIIPKLVDLHTHLRYPNNIFTKNGAKAENSADAENGIEKETFAAQKGGFGTVFSMPNTNPVCDSIEVIDDIKKQKSYCNIEIIAAITKKSESKKLVDFQKLHKKGVNVFSDDGKCVSSTKLMEEALVISKDLNIVIAEHAQNSDLTNGASVNLGTVSKKFNLKGWDRKAEYDVVKRDISLAKKTNGNIHICHISTKESVELIEHAKKKGVNVTAEVTPHHLSWTDIDIVKNSFNTNYKMNPPLRTKADVKSLIDGIKNETIDVIATDHAPHTFESKNTTFQNASFGIIGFETAFITMYNLLVKSSIISLKKLIKLMRNNPSKIGQCSLPT